MSTRVQQAVICIASALVLLLTHVAITNCNAIRTSVDYDVVEGRSDGQEKVALYDTMRRAADRDLHVGLQQDEVDKRLAKYGIRYMYVDSSTLRASRLYGTGKLADPVVIVTLRPNDVGQWRVTDWEIQR